MADTSNQTPGIVTAASQYCNCMGDLVGGSSMVGAVYWFVYLRQRA